MNCIFRFIGFLLTLGLAAIAQESRTALVIGCDYAGSGLQLPSPVKDAEAVAAKLREVGFPAANVTLLKNPTRKQFLDAVDSFGASLGQRGGAGLFYFSGHGCQHEGQNYLVPAGTSLTYREDLPTEAVAASRIVTRMEAAKNPVNLLFLDACRTNELPSAKQKAGLAKGLASMSGSGLLIGFAAAENRPAFDSGDGSFYTKALLASISKPGVSVLQMLTDVRRDVKKNTGGEQEPFLYAGLDNDFAFIPGNAPRPLPTPEPPRPKTVAERIVAATKDAPFTNSLGLEFVPVPGTEVLACRTETTRGAFRQFIREKKHDMSGGMYVLKIEPDGKDYNWKEDRNASWENPGFAQTDEHPVVGVSYLDAKAFAAWLSEKEGVTYRLPTDAEWSKMVGTTKYPWGSSDVPPGGAGNYAGEESKAGMPATWDFIKGYRDGEKRTAPVGQFTANRLGIHDLGGNVWEFCEDEYKASMNSAEALETIPVLKNEKYSDGTPFRVLRGASWSSNGSVYLRSAFRNYGHPTYRNVNYGFRLVVSVR